MRRLLATAALVSAAALTPVPAQAGVELAGLGCGFVSSSDPFASDPTQMVGLVFAGPFAVGELVPGAAPATEVRITCAVQDTATPGDPDAIVFASDPAPGVALLLPQPTGYYYGTTTFVCTTITWTNPDGSPGRYDVDSAPYLSGVTCPAAGRTPLPGRLAETAVPALVAGYDSPSVPSAGADLEFPGLGCGLRTEASGGNQVGSVFGGPLVAVRPVLTGPSVPDEVRLRCVVRAGATPAGSSVVAEYEGPPGRLVATLPPQPVTLAVDPLTTGVFVCTQVFVRRPGWPDATYALEAWNRCPRAAVTPGGLLLPPRLRVWTSAGVEL